MPIQNYANELRNYIKSNKNDIFDNKPIRHEECYFIPVPNHSVKVYISQYADTPVYVVTVHTTAVTEFGADGVDIIFITTDIEHARSRALDYKRSMVEHFNE